LEAIVWPHLLCSPSTDSTVGQNYKQKI
jgi:hypothetical protein